MFQISPKFAIQNLNQMKFIFNINNPHKHYIQITAEFDVVNSETVIYFPAWRPGRYELGDFAKNINHFTVLNEASDILSFYKINKNTWRVDTRKCKKMIVKYSYYAAELNAGSTFLNGSQLYVNPVNCCLFTADSEQQSIEVMLNIPDNWDIAHSLSVENNIFIAQNYDELADSPFICSPNLQHQTYNIDDVKFNIWFNGLVYPDWPRLLNDFEKFSKKQIKKFTQFPEKEYHFLFQILPYKAYHGVEHCKSTVISFGPSYAVFEELYTELLGISSHELYHSWNIKTIRPIEMMPYDFKKENYSELGYVAEGVTTYMGDLMLFRSKVFNQKQYFKELGKQVQKHFDNFGRKNYSVAASSFDTWLDGYTQGAPERKVSIYTEGGMLAFIADTMLLKSTNNKYGIDEVMRRLYTDFACKNKGYSKIDYKNMLEEISGIDFSNFFRDHVEGTISYLPPLQDALTYLGLQLKEIHEESFFASKLGAKLTNQCRVTSVYPDGPLDQAGVSLEDEIIAVNDIKINQDADRWAQFFATDTLKLTVERSGEIIYLSVIASENRYFQKLIIEPVSSPSKIQENAFLAWSDNDILT